MKIFIPTSGCTDSIGVLYYILSSSSFKKDEITTCLIDSIPIGISKKDVGEGEIEKYLSACKWLTDNVRSFNYNIFTEGKDLDLDWDLHKQTYNDNNFIIKESEVISKSQYLRASLAKKYKADKVITGFNLSNWYSANWFYFPNHPKLKHPYSVIKHLLGEIPFEKPFVEQEKGKFEVYESIPDDLKKECFMGQPHRIKMMKWYHDKKKEGKTASELDDYVMKAGHFGKYWLEHPDHDTATRMDNKKFMYEMK